VNNEEARKKQVDAVFRLFIGRLFKFMDPTLINKLAQELADLVNKEIDIPLVNEENEQAFFEVIIRCILSLLLSKIGK
jgi:hypothetical protein